MKDKLAMILFAGFLLLVAATTQQESWTALKNIAQYAQGSETRMNQDGLEYNFGAIDASDFLINVSRDSLEEDSSYYFDGTFDSLLTYYSKPYYIGGKLNMTGGLQALASLVVPTGQDSFVLAAVYLEYGTQYGTKKHWHGILDTLITFGDSTANGTAVRSNIYNNMEMFSTALDASDTTYDGIQTYSNIVRFVTVWPDCNYVNLGSNGIRKGGYVNATNVRLTGGIVAMDSAR